MQENNEIHYLAEEFEEKKVQASTGKRFANFVIDYIVLIIIFFVFAVISIYGGFYQDVSLLFDNLLFNWLIYVVFMFLMETFTKGKSIGKLITKTRAVNKLNGGPISAKTALLRSLCRILPFEPLSALSHHCYPWHDKWTGSIVIED